MPRIRSPERTAVILVTAFVAAVVASLLLAPMIEVQGCAASTDSRDPSCQDYPPQTLWGYEANVWIWIAALLAISVIAFWLIRRAKPRP